MAMFSPRARKASACFLLAVMSFNTFFPAVSYALTSGPTQPEATSFEPVDTTDMVNLATGDLTYNIPLLEVPGPEGGYPLSLSYHAGIQPNVDASWVGLGWTLNPGAINRTANGYPDDWNNVNTISRTYWSGGVTSTYSAGVNIGGSNSALNASFGLSVTNDTYKGFSVGLTGQVAGVGFQMGPQGKTNVSFSAMGFSLSENNGVGSASYMPPALGALMNTVQRTSNGFGVNLAGIASFGHSSSNTNNIQTSSVGFKVNIPITSLLTISLGYSRTRYFTDETTSSSYCGSLNYLGAGVPDAYSIVEDPSQIARATNTDPGFLQGGSFFAFDDYEVSAQGLGGSMRPYVLQATPFEQNRPGTGAPINGVVPNQITYNDAVYERGLQKGGFRFINDFSNSYTQPYTVPTDPTTDIYNTNPTFGTPTYPAVGYSGTQLAGSRHIDVGVKVLPTQALGYTGVSTINGSINGFSITNESGVTYHYGLPEYTWNEEIYSQNTAYTSPNVYFNRQTKASAYAYAWLLTTITGPDYVDRNNNGVADAGDWGYWVNFEYGKWSDSYTWRNPAEGYQTDMDNGFRDCSMGVKELYYLNAIQTRTNTALFEKNTRYDAKGCSPTVFTKKGNNADYALDGLFSDTSSQSLRLSKIYILNNADANFVNPAAGSTATMTPAYRASLSPNTYEMPANVIDSADVAAAGRSTLESKALRIIDFAYDYSSCPGAHNSFNYNNVNALLGKLTLKTLNFRGQGGASVMPPMQFGYELAAQDAAVAAGTLSSTTFTTPTSSTVPVFNVGDLLVSDDANQYFCGVVTLAVINGGVATYTLANNQSPATGSVTVRTTKNPPYNKDAYDMWGMYKSDFSESNLTTTNANVLRNTTLVSAPGTDVWSLRTVTTKLGGTIKIKYQPDDYQTCVLGNGVNYIVNSPSLDGADNLIKFQVNTFGYSLASALPIGSTGSILLDIDYPSANNIIYGYASYTVTSIDVNQFVHVTLATPLSTTDGTPTPMTGNLSPNQGLNALNRYGGNIRVSSLNSIDETGRTFSTLYNYTNPVSGLSSGTTSYLPKIFDDYDRTIIPTTGNGILYVDALHVADAEVERLAVAAPPPGIVYQYVITTTQVQNPDESAPRVLPGKTVYQFDVFSNNMIQMVDVTPALTTTGGVGGTLRNEALQSFTGSVGNLISITKYDNNNHVIGKTVNHYLHDALGLNSPAEFMSNYKGLLAQAMYGNQGYIMERVTEVKVTNPPQGITSAPGGNKTTYTSRESLPCIQTGQTIYDYVNGTQQSSTNLKFDLFSGATTEVVTTDSYGNNFLQKTVPAYTVYPAMGLKINNDNNKNMLSQVAETYVYKAYNNTTDSVLSLISANVTNWSDLCTSLDLAGVSHVQNGATDSVNGVPLPKGDIWRKQASYAWQANGTSTDGTTPLSSFSDFNWATPSASNASWKLTSEATLFDINSKELENLDINGNYTASKMGYNGTKVILTGGPAKYSEIAYSGAEDETLNYPNGLGFVTIGSGVLVNGTVQSTVTSGLQIPVAHTGNYSLQIPASGNGYIYSTTTDSLNPNNNYMASVWIMSPDGTIPSNTYLQYTVGSTVVQSAAVNATTKTDNGNWRLITLMINGSNLVAHQTFTIGCYNTNTSSTFRIYADDFRFQPINAATTAYEYDPVTALLTYSIDNNNMYTRYTYDTEGRLTGVYKDKLSVGEIKAQTFQYNYGQPVFTSY